MWLSGGRDEPRPLRLTAFVVVYDTKLAGSTLHDKQLPCNRSDDCSLQLPAAAIHQTGSRRRCVLICFSPPPLRETYGGGSACPALTVRRPRRRDLEVTLAPYTDNAGRTLTAVQGTCRHVSSRSACAAGCARCEGCPVESSIEICYTLRACAPVSRPAARATEGAASTPQPRHTVLRSSGSCANAAAPPCHWPSHGDEGKAGGHRRRVMRARPVATEGSDLSSHCQVCPTQSLFQCPRSTPNAQCSTQCCNRCSCPPTGSNAATNQPRAPAVSRGLSRVARHARAWLGRRAWPLVAASQRATPRHSRLP